LGVTAGPGRSRLPGHAGTPLHVGMRGSPGGLVVAIEQIGVVGSGIMGSGIAEVAARSGFSVVLRTRTDAAGEAMQAGISRSIAKQIDRGKLSAEEGGALLGRITVCTDLNDLARCDLVIESVVEDLAVKKHLFAQLDDVCRFDAVVATNTSTLSVTQLAMETKRPDRVCGIHFFNPVGAMPLVELVRALTTSEETLAAARDFAERCGKRVVDVKDSAGFIVNALLFPYLNHAVKLLDSGVATRDDIDAAMKGGCNFPMGPLELLDLVGLDTSLAILEALYAESHDTAAVPAPSLRRLVEAGRLGRKSGRGFYEYD
jgi:3-hydroxybutyryl-CoA dehydrogenase